MATDKTIDAEVDTLVALFGNLDELHDFPLPSEGMPVMKENAKEFFKLELPYKGIKAVVMEEKDLFFAKLDSAEKQPKFEHVGSTSISGMPGTLMADALIIDESFPPSRPIVKALLESGWKFISVSAFDLNTLWFTKRMEKEPLQGQLMLMNVTGADNKMGTLLVKTRELCNAQMNAFQEYKDSKIEAAKGKDGTYEVGYEVYKMQKAMHGFSTRLRTEFGIESPHAEKFVEKVKQQLSL